MKKIANSALDLVGNTPMVELSRLGREAGAVARVVAKVELFNPAGSVKDRIALAMVEEAEARGTIRPGATIIEPTSGNTGVGLALVSALKGYKLMPVPENPELRARLANHSLEELTEILKQYKTLHNSTDVDTVKRAIRAIEIEEYYAVHPVPEREFPKLNSLIIGVDIDRELRREKITRRLKQRLDEGMVDEVRRLTEQGISPDDLIYYGLEYKFLTLYVIGKLTYEEMFTELETAIHQFAKRQMTWFRGMERRGFTIHWVSAELPMEEKIAFVIEKLRGN